MKLRNFKKAIRRVGYYKHREPRILCRISGWDDTRCAYYSCHRLKAVMCLESGKWESVTIKRGSASR